MRSIAELPKHPTEIYVVGSGRSLQYIRKDFWKDKITIGINGIYKYYPVKYGITQHTSLIKEMIEAGVIAICPEYDMAMYNRPREILDGDFYLFKHVDNTLYDFSERHTGYTEIDLSDFDNPETLVVGGVTTSAIHLAYKMCATSIILVGIDGGDLDGKRNPDEYPPVIATAYMHTYEMQPQIDLICNEIRKRGVGVYSLNPFNNFQLEKHVYEPSSVPYLKEQKKNDDIYLNEDRYEQPKEMFKFMARHAFPELNYTGSVIDIGCASGEFLHFIRKYNPEANLYGVDFSKNLIEYARRNVKAIFYQGTVLDGHLLAENSYDKTFMSGVLCSLDSFNTCFNNLINWTKPGGTLYITEMFNPYPLDVHIQFKEPTDTRYEINWNVFSQESVSKYLEGNPKVKSFKFIKFGIPIDLPKQNDPVRSWTIYTKEGREIINGIGVIEPFYLLEIKL